MKIGNVSQQYSQFFLSQSENSSQTADISM